MKTLVCPGCKAPIAPNISSKFLKCEYCGASFVNEHFNEGSEEESCPQELNLLCVKLLKEIGSQMAQNIPNCVFGSPIKADELCALARENFEVPDEDDVYFVCASGRKGSCDRGFAMADSGIYFHDEEDDCARYTWDQFVDEDVSYDGNVLTIIESTFRTRSSTEAVGDFLIAFTNKAYAEWYNEEPAGASDLDNLCIQRLVEKCEDTGINILNGDPLPDSKQLKNARAAMAIPEEDDVYLLYDNTILSSGKNGFAMTDSGVYYNTGLLGSKGQMSWEEFVTSPISYELPDEKEKSTLGELNFCDCFTLSFNFRNERKKIMFFIELHNELYEEHSGKRAPSDWGIHAKEKSLLNILLE